MIRSGGYTSSVHGSSWSRSRTIRRLASLPTAGVETAERTVLMRAQSQLSTFKGTKYERGGMEVVRMDPWASVGGIALVGVLSLI